MGGKPNYRRVKALLRKVVGRDPIAGYQSFWGVGKDLYQCEACHKKVHERGKVQLQPGPFFNLVALQGEPQGG